MIEAGVRRFILDNYLLAEDYLLPGDTSLLDAGVVDSTGVIELITFIEETFEIEMPDEDLVPANLDTVNRIVAYIGRRLG